MSELRAWGLDEELGRAERDRVTEAMLARTRTSRAQSLRAMVGSVLFGVAMTSCGPIDAPHPALDLAVHPEAFQTEFDRHVGTPRLVLLLSPA